MFPRTKHCGTLWELYFWYLKSPFPGLSQIFQLDYISHDATVPSCLMIFLGRQNCEVFAVQGCGYQKYCYYGPRRNCYTFSKSIFSALAKSFCFSAELFFTKNQCFLWKNHHILTWLVLNYKGRMNLSGTIPKGLDFQLVSINIMSTCYEESNADLEELKI